MRTGNPILSEKTFQPEETIAGERLMTLPGTVNRTGFLLLILVLAAAYSWNQFLTGGAEAATPYLASGLIGGLVLALVTIFKKTWSPYTAPMYAACEGLFLGALSGMFEAQYAGIVFQAVGLTFGVLFGLLVVYRLGIIPVTENFKLGVAAATGGIMLFYLVNIILGFIGINIPYIHESGAIGIGFSLFVVTIAALNLVLDFDFIENGVENGAPKYMEWFAAFGLIVTLVWLYIEILRLLAKLRSR